jgi:hypothetical protein
MNIEWSELKSSYQQKNRLYYSTKLWHDNGLMNQKKIHFKLTYIYDNIKILDLLSEI